MEHIFIPKDSIVKIYFKNGTIIEGTVLTWNDKKGLLQSHGNQNRMIIYNPAENVMMVKLFYPEQIEETSAPQEVIDQPIVKHAFKEESNDLESDTLLDLVPSESINDRTKKIVNYRLSQAAHERKKIAESMRRSVASTNILSDFSKQLPKVETKYYGSPDFTKRGAIINSRKKNN